MIKFVATFDYGIDGPTHASVSANSRAHALSELRLMGHNLGRIASLKKL